MNTIYIDKFRSTTMIDSKNKFKTLVWQLRKYKKSAASAV